MNRDILTGSEAISAHYYTTMCIVQYSTVQYSTVQYSIVQVGPSFMGPLQVGLWYAAVGVVKMLHTDNKQQIRKLIQSPSKRRSYVTPGGLYHRPNLERAHKVLAQLVP